MYRKLLKGVIVSVSVVFFTLMLGYMTYFATLNVINRSAVENINSAEAVSSQAVPIEEEPEQSPEIILYYLARLNGDNIEIYLCSDNTQASNSQKYLYSFKVYPSDIPDEDILNLSRGIVLRSKEELTSFEEDYNS